ncbi:MAG: fumarylacetoacetase [Candidatus Thermoplasmatota archaeon]|nr:fumarylacetoacetase [Candidatus Thermoplasmatota archaeon]MEC8997092.1 fumarylacetoacetase [Candidatus Thermoplasmatota archaeon]MED6306031.1 fumarylacetoacetase [Candidatus Thermoplasmatota archaeon]
MDVMDGTHDSKLKSWIETDENSDFPIQNIPFGIYCPKGGGDLHVATAIGEYVLDLACLDDAGLFSDTEIEGTEVFHEPTLNAFMSMGRKAWKDTRKRISELLSEGNSTLQDDKQLCKLALIPMKDAEMQLPVDIGDYTDFYSSREHASNVGTIFRGPENALMPNWLHLPVGYHGRASSVVLNGTDIMRPKGQSKGPDMPTPLFSDSKRMDFELEMGVLIGTGNNLGEPVSVKNAEEHVFGLALVNDWSARDIQAWEYQPLGPFLAKNFATTISPWIITLEALEPFRCSGPKQDPEPLEYLRSGINNAFDINLGIYLRTEKMDSYDLVSSSNYNYLYWDMKQQIAHHTITGCNLRTGDLLASGTISGPDKDSRGSMLELTWGWSEPIKLSNGEERIALEDGDTVMLKGWCQGKGYQIGFGECIGQLLPSN